MILRTIAAFALLTVTLRADLIPEDRLYWWVRGQTLGVPGGIISTRGTTVDLTGSVNTNSLNAGNVIIAAIASAATNTLIKLPAGRYIITNLSGVNLSKNFITLRGAGMDQTLLVLSNASGLSIGSDPQFAWDWPAAGGNECSSVLRGASNVTITGSTTPDSSWIGNIIRLTQRNSADVLHTQAFERRQQEKFIVTAVSGQTVTFHPPIAFSLTNQVTIAFGFTQAKFSGIEDMTIVCTNTSVIGGFGGRQTYACWLKGVKVTRAKNFSAGFSDSIFPEIRQSWIDKSEFGDAYPGPNHSGVGISGCTGWWVEDNIVDQEFPGLEVNAASVGGAFTYNFVNVSFWGGQVNGNHGPHNAYNLYEGNKAFSFQNDGYYGSGSYDIVYRNHLHGIYGGNVYFDQQNAGIHVLNLNRLVRNYTVIGNIFGNSLNTTSYFGLISLGAPNIGNQSTDGTYGPPFKVVTKTLTGSQSGTTLTATAPVFNATNALWYVVNYSTSAVGQAWGQVMSVSDSTHATLNLNANAPPGTSFALAPGPEGWQETDTNVYASTIFKQNHWYPIQSPVINSSQVNPIKNPAGDIDTPSSDPLPFSLIYSNSTPSWWTSGVDYPPFDPANPTEVNGNLTNSVNKIPAQLRYYNMGGGSTGGSTGGSGDPAVRIRPGVNLKGGIIVR